MHIKKKEPKPKPIKKPMNCDFVWPSKLSTKLKKEKKEKSRMEIRFNDFRTGFTPELEDCEPIQRYLASL
ncbi:hypothetical protein HDV04_003840 [Boothiomyces sp. JEL0838]|nr:hypothetical protein HDV04_003840 [Boothiomyces sp. JEL0838]